MHVAPPALSTLTQFFCFGADFLIFFLSIYTQVLLRTMYYTCRTNRRECITKYITICRAECRSNVLYEFCRVVKPGGYVLCTNREDIHYQKKFDVTLQKMESEGIVKQAYMSPPQPYLPQNPEYAEKIKVLYFAYQLCM